MIWAPSRGIWTPPSRGLPPALLMPRIPSIPTIPSVSGRGAGKKVVAGGGGGPFVNDTFTGSAGTTLGVHVGETGATWTGRTGANSGWILGTTPSNSLRANLGIGNNGLITASGTPPGADYYVEGRFQKTGPPAYEDQLGLICRFVSTSLYVRAAYSTVGNALTLVAVGGTGNTSTTWTPTNGTFYVWRITCLGNSFDFTIDGVSMLSFTDAALSAAGSVGIWGKHGGTLYWDYFTAAA